MLIAAGGVIQYLFLRKRAIVIEYAGNFALMHDRYAIGHAQDFRQLRRNHDDRNTGANQIVDDILYFELCAVVDAALGFIQHDYL